MKQEKEQKDPEIPKITLFKVGRRNLLFLNVYNAFIFTEIKLVLI